MYYDVAIVGAGPIGARTGKLIAEQGFSVIMLEEHYEIGRPVRCAGLVSPRVIELTNAKETIISKPKGAIIHSPNQELFIESKDQKALVIDRAKFDKKLAKASLRAGCELLLSAEVTGAERKQNRVNLKFLKSGKESKLECNILIGADGANSITARIFGLSRPKELLSGISAELATKQKEFVEIFVSHKLAPGFFAWFIPAGENLRAGLCAQTNSYYYFKKFLEQLGDPKLISWTGGVIPLGLSTLTYTDNVMLVGDAASQVKPLSGGGIYTGLLSAQYCAQTATQALEKEDYSAKLLSRYQRLWKRKIGKELKLGMLGRNVFKKLSDSDFDKILSKLNNPKILALISKYGDLDYHSRVMKALLVKAPQVASLIKPLLKAAF